MATLQTKTNMEQLKQYIDEQIKKHIHDGNFSQRINLFDIYGQIETVTTAPSNAPVGGSPYEQIKIHYNSTGPVWKLYIYDYQNSSWKSVTLS